MTRYLDQRPFQPEFTRPHVVGPAGDIYSILMDAEVSASQDFNTIRVFVDGDDGNLFLAIGGGDLTADDAHVPMPAGTVETFARIQGQTMLAMKSEVQRTVYVTVGRGNG